MSNCDDGNVCTVDACTGPNPGDCSHSAPPNCDGTTNWNDAASSTEALCVPVKGRRSCSWLAS